VIRSPDDALANPETLVDVLARRAEEDPRAPAVTVPGRGTMTVGEWWSGSQDTARALLSPAAGLRPGDAVLTCLRPGPALLHVLGGTARAGLVEVPQSLDVPATVAMAAAASAGATVAILGASAVAANPGLRGLTRSLRVLVADDGDTGESVEGALRLSELGGPRVPLPGFPSPGDPALIMSTSGTTGRPKGVVLPHFAGVRHARRVVISLGYGPADVLYNAFPWNHINIRHAGLLAALVSGGRLLAVPRFSASTFWALCRQEGVTAFNFMGAIAAILLRSPPGADDRAHRVSRAYGGPAPRWLVDAFQDRFGVRLVEAYACTELGDVASNTVTDVVPGTAGRTVPEYELRLVDDDGTTVPDGHVGRITVRPRAPHVRALRYVGGDTLTGWSDTGDRGRLDPAGRLVFEGRHTDVVRRRGENISAWEVESVLGRLPGVQDVAAVGVPSELTEEDLLVAVVPADGSLDVPAVRAWCRDHLPRHAWPRYVVLLDQLPRNAATKVRKHALRTPEVLRASDDADPQGGLPYGMQRAGNRTTDLRGPR
jgi:crotonobetaine/carnitine-CoA ligase